jgi:hypothetical protein
MTNQQHPITPPEATVLSLRNSAPHGIRDAGVTRELWLINHAYAAGADQELEACEKWVASHFDGMFVWSATLRNRRRPKPPSLKEQALGALDRMNQLPTAEDQRIIRRALEALPE